MPFTVETASKGGAAPVSTAARGMYMDAGRPPGPRRMCGNVGCFALQRRPLPQALVEAIQRQGATMEYAPASEGTPASFELANRWPKLAPGQSRPRVLCKLGSESVDTALEDRAFAGTASRRGAPHEHSRQRARIHGVGFGGIVGGFLEPKMLRTMLKGFDHPRTRTNYEKTVPRAGNLNGRAHCR